MNLGFQRCVPESNHVETITQIQTEGQSAEQQARQSGLLKMLWEKRLRS